MWSAESSFTTVPNRVAVLETSKGRIKFELHEDKAPITTANFIKLADSGFYDGLIFHRVVDNFVIQTGDPKGNGTGGSSATINLEIHKDLTHTTGLSAWPEAITRTARHPSSTSATARNMVWMGITPSSARSSKAWTLSGP